MERPMNIISYLFYKISLYSLNKNNYLVNNIKLNLCQILKRTA